jgi:hypothetical protein
MEVTIMHDARSNMKFCIKSGTTLNIEHPLIEWCSQFVKDGNFLDIEPDDNTYAILLSKHCKTVYIYEPQQVYTLPYDVMINNINNVVVPLSKQLDDVQDVSFIKIYKNVEQRVKSLVKVIINNYYPPIIYKGPCELIKQLGYNIYPVTGCHNIYLASDHPLFKKKPIDTTTYYDNLKTYKSLPTDNIIQYIAMEAYKYGDLKHGLEACESIILNPLSTNTIINNYLYHAYHYMCPLPIKYKISLNCPMPKNRVANNPSILKIPGGYLCDIRACNHTDNPNVVFLDPDCIYRSDHYQLTLDETFMIKKTVLLNDVTNNVYHKSFVEGIDDLRLIDQSHFTCSHGNLNTNRLIEQCLGTFDSTTGEVTKLVALKGPTPNRHEKNWLPLVTDKDIYVIYFIDPFILYKVNQDTGELTKIDKKYKLSDKNLTNFRGSAGCIKYKDGWLCTTHHQVIYNQQFYYIHRFVWFDKDFTTLKYSIPFYFTVKGIEFSPGICLNDNNEVVITYSMWEHNATLIVVDCDVVNKYLNI